MMGRIVDGLITALLAAVAFIAAALGVLVVFGVPIGIAAVLLAAAYWIWHQV